MGSLSARVAFVGGHGRSGSTLLSRLLGAIPGYVAVGELNYLWDQGVVNDRSCGCGEPFHACPFWTAVGKEAFGGWDEATARRAWSLRRSVHRVRLVPLMAAPRVLPAYQRRFAEYAGLMARVYAAVRVVSGAEVVVDSSKYPSAAYLLRRAPGVDLRVVHLVRSSHGVCHSWTKLVARPDRDGRPMARYPPLRTAVEWDVYNGLLGALPALGVPRLLVRYEDLVRAPAAQLARASRFLGAPAGDLPFLHGDEVDLPADHSVAGNPMRFTVGRVPLRLDEGWRAGMPRATRAAVTVLTAPGLVRYGYLPESSDYMKQSLSSGRREAR